MNVNLGHILTVFSIIVAVVCTSGLGVFLVKYGTRMKLQEEASARHDEELKRLTMLNVASRLSAVEEAVRRIDGSLEKLNMIPALTEKLDFLVRSMEKVMPRSEIELRFENQEQKIETLKEKLVSQ